MHVTPHLTHFCDLTIALIIVRSAARVVCGFDLLGSHPFLAVSPIWTFPAAASLTIAGLQIGSLVVPILPIRSHGRSTLSN